jgi:regulator of replication initiation timing
MENVSAKKLKEAVFKQVAEYRQGLSEGLTDISGLEDGVRSYCEAVAALPVEEGRLHAQDLSDLTREVAALGAELKEAHAGVRSELAGLGRLRQANVAYSKSDAIGPVHRRKKEEGE